VFDVLPLATGETILWQGRPAPRAYTFRNWRHALFGLALTLPCLLWQLVGIELAAGGAPFWTAWLPLPFNLGAFYLGFGQLLVARLEWERVYYAVSNQTIYHYGGLFRPRLNSMPISALAAVRQKKLGPNLATIRMEPKEGAPLVFAAIEHPELLLPFLPVDSAGKNP
jgi:hypothetical protein